MLMLGRVLLYLVFIITAAESRSNRNVIDIHIESENDNQGGANLKSTECQCEKMGGYCIENGDHCNGTIEILHDSGDDQCCCCLPKPRESTEYQCEKMGGFCIENGDHCNGTIEILHNSGDDQCCCCIPKRESTAKQCKHLDGFCVESGDICNGIMEILYNSYDDHCCCCIPFTPGENGNCTLWGDPHFIVSANGIVSRKYDIQTAGISPLTQYWAGGSLIFEVKSKFYYCWGRTDISCIEDVTYYEDGGEIIRLSLLDKPGDITVYVDGKKRPDQRNGIIGLVTYNLEMILFDPPYAAKTYYPCMHIDGSKGIKVTLCYVAKDYGIIYISYKFNPSLKNLPGLCEWSGSLKKDNDNSRKVRIATELDDEDRCANKTVLQEVNRRCNDSINWACEFLPLWECNVYREACIFDLCRVHNLDEYAEGYAAHMGIHRHLFYNATMNCA